MTPLLPRFIRFGHAGPEQDARAELSTAIKQGELRVHYQPVVDAISGGLVAIEALSRWNDPFRGLQGGGVVAALADRGAAAARLTDWVLRTVCADLSAWRSASLSPPPTSINLSEQEAVDDELAGRLTAALDRSSLPAGALVVEIPQRALDAPEAADAVSAVRAAGIGVEVDAFILDDEGIERARAVGARGVKIDIPSAIAHSRIEQIGARLEMAHGLGLVVTGKRVQSYSELEFFRSLDFDRMQGHAYSGAVPARDLRDLLPHTTAAAQHFAG